MTAQMKKGALELCILHLVSKSELYGYEIMRRITEVFPDTNESTVYTILRRLLTDGRLLCYSRDESNGPPRKYYRVTDSGSLYLTDSMAGWNTVTRGVSEIIKG